MIGEGEKDEAPMLFNGERVGDGNEPQVDVAVDPIDGTTLTAKGLNNALSVIAVSERGAMFDPGPSFYMGQDRRRPRRRRRDRHHRQPDPEPALDREVEAEQRARPDGGHPRPPRHADLIDEVRASGARIRLINDGDVYGAIASAWPDAGVDVLFGVGGTPEGSSRQRR